MSNALLNGACKGQFCRQKWLIWGLGFECRVLCNGTAEEKFIQSSDEKPNRYGGNLIDMGEIRFCMTRLLDKNGGLQLIAYYLIAMMNIKGHITSIIYPVLYLGLQSQSFQMYPIGRRNTVLYPLMMIHPLERFLDLVVPVAERNNEPFPKSNQVQGNTLADP
jgi:hypothetical protein